MEEKNGRNSAKQWSAEDKREQRINNQIQCKCSRWQRSNKWFSVHLGQFHCIMSLNPIDKTAREWSAIYRFDEHHFLFPFSFECDRALSSVWLLNALKIDWIFWMLCQHQYQLKMNEIVRSHAMNLVFDRGDRSSQSKWFWYVQVEWGKRSWLVGTTCVAVYHCSYFRSFPLSSNSSRFNCSLILISFFFCCDCALLCYLFRSISSLRKKMCVKTKT